MKIKLRVKEIAEKKGVVTPYQLQKAAALSPSNASKLFNGTSAHISLTTLAKLCNALKCRPGDLLAIDRRSK